MTGRGRSLLAAADLDEWFDHDLPISPRSPFFMYFVGGLELGRSWSTKVFFMGGWSLDGVNRQRCSSWEAGARKGRTDKGVVHGEGGSLEGVDRQRCCSWGRGELGRGGSTKERRSRRRRRAWWRRSRHHRLKSQPGVPPRPVFYFLFLVLLMLCPKQCQCGMWSTKTP